MRRQLTERPQRSELFMHTTGSNYTNYSTTDAVEEVLY